MNLLGKVFSIKNILKPGLILLIPVFFGCETQDNLGVKYDLGSDANVKFIEFTLPSTNLYLDSLRTDRENRILVGNFTDPVTGSISAEGYLSFFYLSGPLPSEPPSISNPFPEDSLKLDSLILTLESFQSLSNSSTFQQEFSLIELQDSLKSGVVYLSDLQQPQRALIETFSASVTPEQDSIYRIKINNFYGQLIFSELSRIARDTTRFVEATFFQSLGLVPGGSSTGITEINLASDTTRLILYASPLDNNDTSYATSFVLTGNHYTYLERNLAGTEFSGIVENENFDITSGETLVDPLAGITTAVSLAPLDDFFFENDNILINNATLSFEIQEDNARDTLVDVMAYLRKPDGGIFGSAIESDPFGNILMTDLGYLRNDPIPASGELSNDNSKILIPASLFFQQLYRQYSEGDSLAYLNQQTGNIKPVDDLVLISLTDLTFQRSIIKKDGVKIRLYYTEVE